MMKLCHATLIIAVLAASSVAQTARNSRNTAVLVPADVGLTTIVSQTDCPLKIQEAGMLRYLAGGYGPYYRLHNSGTKTIVGYKIAKWGSNNSGSVVEWRATGDEPPLLPGHNDSQSSEVHIIPLTVDLRAKFDLQPPMRGIVFLLVVKVEFSDGSKYDASSLLSSLQHHLENFEGIYEKLKDK
jgi:hypothetical protein